MAQYLKCWMQVRNHLLLHEFWGAGEDGQQRADVAALEGGACGVSAAAADVAALEGDVCGVSAAAAGTDVAAFEGDVCCVP